MLKQAYQLTIASGTLLAAKSALLGIRTLVLLIVAAHGGTQDLAAASLALALAEAGRWVADFGTDTWTVRAFATARSAGNEARLLTAAALVKAVGSALVGLSIFAVCRSTLPANGNAFGCMAALLLITSQVAGLAISYFQAKDEVTRLTPVLIPCGATALAAFLALRLSGGALAAVAALTVGEIMIAAMLILMLRKRVGFAGLSSVLPDAARMARSCVPTAAFGIVVGLYSRLDTFVLAEFSLAALAIYTVAQRLFQPFQIAATSFGAIVYSRAAVLHSEGLPVARLLFRREMPAIVGCSIVCSAVLFFGGRPLVIHVFPQYQAAIGPLSLLCVLPPILAYNSAMTGVLLALGRYWSVLTVAIIDLALTYLCMITLIPLKGADGTAICMLIGALINGAALSLAVAITTRSPAREARPITSGPAST
jgi:O-antigen/teichoic acid export membrane protein